MKHQPTFFFYQLGYDLEQFHNMGNFSPVATPRIHSVASAATRSLYIDSTLETVERLAKQSHWKELEQLLSKVTEIHLND